jgi:hypothetical protein
VRPLRDRRLMVQLLTGEAFADTGLALLSFAKVHQIDLL